MNLCFLDISYSWSDIICGLLCWASLIQHNVFKVYPCWTACARAPFLSWVSDVPLNGFTTPCLSFLRWWTLGCFHLWATVINAVVKIRVQGFVWTSIFISLGCISRSGIAGSSPGGSDGKQSACNAGDLGSIPGLGRFPWRREWQPTPVFLCGEFHGLRSLVGYSPWGCKESDTTEWLTLWTFDCSKCLLNMVIWC